MSRLDDTIEAKKEKRASLEKAGIHPHPYNFDKQHSIAEALEAVDTDTTITTAGRLVAIRTHGKVCFTDLFDQTGTIQIMIKENAVGDWFENLTYIDRGDFLGITGKVIVTKTGETTINAEKVTFLGKALRPLPTEWNAAENKEVRFRQRYVDMLISDQTKKVMDARWTILKQIRRFLQDEYNFVEVETPILQPLYGGTNASPFTTHMNALDTEFYLRLAPELYLKRLIVGGYDRVFEIARNFRNEGIDQTHQPEFTMIEWYHAYADYHTMMDVAEELIKHVTEAVNGEQKITVHDQELDISGEWPRIKMVDAVKEHLNINFEQLSDEKIAELLKKHQFELIGDFTRGKALFAIFDKLVAEKLIEPTWIIDYPRDVSPLSKEHRSDKNLAERFECYIGGKELADGWSEITDPIDQRSIFENEQKRMRAGDDEAHPLDEDFLKAMDYGMPPLGGIGMGIDRLVMFLTNTWSIKEVIAFPTLRPNFQRPVDKPIATKAEPKKQTQNKQTKQKPLPPRDQAIALLEQYIENDNLRHHCYMVAEAMAAYARDLGEDEELWYQTGLLHDLDWEQFPDEHPNKAINDILADDYPQIILDAIAAHAPDRTGKEPATTIEKYLFACDELSGFMYAVSLMRPNGFSDMKYKSVKKKLKDKGFAATVSRDDISTGIELINKEPSEHITFLIEVFKERPTNNA